MSLTLSPAKALAEEFSRNRTLLIREILLNPTEFTQLWHTNRRYTLYNQALLFIQLRRRRIPLGPVQSFNAWRDMGNPVASGQQAIYVMAPKDLIGFHLTPVFALSQTRNPQLQIPITPLPPVSEELRTIDAWFTYVYSMIPHQERPNFEYEATLVTLLVLISFAGGVVASSPQFQPFIEGTLQYLNEGLLTKEAQVLQGAQRILRDLFR